MTIRDIIKITKKTGESYGVTVWKLEGASPPDKPKKKPRKDKVVITESYPNYKTCEHAHCVETATKNLVTVFPSCQLRRRDKTLPKDQQFFVHIAQCTSCPHYGKRG